jgi:hypothetical protein
MARKPAKRIKKAKDVEIAPDAWERFTKTIGKVVPAKTPKPKKA